MHLLRKKTYGFVLPDHIDQIEAQYLKTRGALMRGILGEYESVHDYDINSMYPHIMTLIMFPVKAGTFHTLQSLPEKLEYGIYRCSIKATTPLKKNMLFLFTDENKYTHYDITTARSLGLTIQMIKDGKANALIYTKDKLEYGSKMFKPTIDYLYDLKKKNLPYVKTILNSVWGALVAKRKMKDTVDTNVEYIIPDNVTLEQIYPIGEDKIRFKYHKNNDTFKTNYARIGIFLTSYARMHMARTMLPHIDSIIRFHTDSILSLKPIPELKISDKMGQWKYVHYKKANIYDIHKKPNYN
jgi:hypothetical protein